MDYNNTVTAVNVTATPVGPAGNPQPQVQQGQPSLQQTVQDVAQAVNEAMNQFSDEVPPSEQDEQKAKGFLSSFMNYIKGKTFHDDIMATSRKYQIPPKKVAQGFFSACLGTIGDILGIGIATVGNAADTLVDILATIVHGAVGLVVKVANGLASLVTLNRTCVCA